MSSPRLIECPATARGLVSVVTVYPSGQAWSNLAIDSTAQGVGLPADDTGLEGFAASVVVPALATEVVAGVHEVRVLGKGHVTAGGCSGVLHVGLRIGGVVYLGGSVALTTSPPVAEVETVWTTNPATGTGWTYATAAAAQPLLKLVVSAGIAGEYIRGHYLRARALVDVKVGRLAFTGAGRLAFTGAGRVALTEVA